jgi:hypothetical protein
MSAETDAGLLALQSGDIQGAIAQLERAIAADPNDYQAQQYLGAAYGQAGRQMDAVTALTQAVTLQPSNAQARYNLAVAYEGAGYNEQALVAAQQALQLQPDYPKAQEAVARLSGVPTAAPSYAAPGYAAPGYAAPGYAAPPTPQYGQPQEATLYGQPAQPETYQPNQTQPLAGGYAPGQPYGAAPTTQPGAGGSYQGQGAAAYGGSPSATYYQPSPGAGTITADTFSLKQALLDWVQVIRGPHAFFREQAMRDGYGGPMSFLLMYGFAGGVLTILSSLIGIATQHADMAQAIGATLMSFILGIAFAVLGALLWGFMLHIISRLFGGRQPYQNTFRVAAYARAPLLLLALLSAIISPFAAPKPTFSTRSASSASSDIRLIPVQATAPRSMRPGYGAPPSTTAGSSQDFQKLADSFRSGSPVLIPIFIVCLIWVWCLQSIGLRYAQDLSPGAAVGTVFLALFLSLLVLIGIGVLFGVMIAGIMMSARGAPGFAHTLITFAYSPAVWRGL